MVLGLNFGDSKSDIRENGKMIYLMESVFSLTFEESKHTKVASLKAIDRGMES